jgi:hypothetical protein
MLRSEIFIVAAGLVLAGCSSSGMSWTSNKAVNGNNTGGIVPEAVTSEAEQNEMARAHCAQYSKVVRVTALPKDTGGKLIFVCEAPGAPPPPGAAAPQSDPSLPPGVRTKKRQ